MSCTSICPCHGQPVARPRRCPLCLHVFAGTGWDGIDAHYRSRHERDTGIRYEDWWRTVCVEHRG